MGNTLNLTGPKMSFNLYNFYGLTNAKLLHKLIDDLNIPDLVLFKVFDSLSYDIKILKNWSNIGNTFKSTNIMILVNSFAVNRFAFDLISNLKLFKKVMKKRITFDRIEEYYFCD